MGKKNFLPNTRDVEIPLYEGSVAAMGDVVKDAVTQNKLGLPKATKTKFWVMRIFSVLAFLGLIFGGTIAGFSFKMIADNQVGYYNSEPGYMGPGTYFQFPWTKEDMKVVDVGTEFLQLESLTGMLEVNEQEFMIQNVHVVYNVSDVDQYIKTKKNKFPCQIEIENTVLDNIVRTDPEQLQALKELRDIPVPDCGITIERAVLSRPNITQKNSMIVNVDDTQQPCACIASYQTREEVTITKPTTPESEVTAKFNTTTTTQEPENPDIVTNSTLNG